MNAYENPAVAASRSRQELLHCTHVRLGLDAGRPCHLFELVHFDDSLHDLADVGFQHHAAHDHLVQDVVYLITVENYIQLADVLEALVQYLQSKSNR